MSGSVERDRRLDQICDEFENAWKAGNAPDLWALVKSSDNLDAETLLRELIPLDLSYRRARGEPFDAKDYQSAGAEHADLIQTILKELA